jgi:hypothetical protein
MCDSITAYTEDPELFGKFVEWYGHDRAVLEFSGPGLWTDVVLSYMDLTRVFHWKDVGDVTILPSENWGFRGSRFDLPKHEDVHVLHDFEGSWKKNW